MPKKGENTVVEGVISSLLVSLAYSKPFDVEDFFIRNLMHSTSDPYVPKPFAPWIMLYLNHDFEHRYQSGTPHEYFLPDAEGPWPAPPKAKVKGIASSSQQAPPVEAQPLIPPFCQKMSSVGAESEYYTDGTDPSILRERANPLPQTERELLMDIQQKLTKHIKKDRKEKTLTMKELNNGVNFIRLNRQYHEEQMRRPWATLSKFYTP